ncbi:MAG: TolB family protein [Roseimicrobium sp.]
MMSRLPFSLCLALFAIAVAAADSPHPGDAPDHLPPHITRLTWFGERADWRPDGQRFVFLNRAYGDVYEYEFATQRITPCTDHFRHFGFVRALYLSNGDLLLSGPKDNFDRTSKEARQHARDSSYLYVLDKSFTKPPVPLGIQCNEGPAISRRRLRIAWTHGEQDHISVGDIVYENGTPKLANARAVLQSSDFPKTERPRKWIETQSFVPPDDDQITLTGYELNDTDNTDTFVLDLKSGALTNMSRSPERYEECEGIFPDGRSTLVESAEFQHRWPLVDLYRLWLDGSGRKERLTFFTDFKGWKAAEATISDDGKFMLFQDGRGGMESGQGFSIYLYDFAKAAALGAREITQ